LFEPAVTIVVVVVVDVIVVVDEDVWIADLSFAVLSFSRKTEGRSGKKSANPAVVRDDMVRAL